MLRSIALALALAVGAPSLALAREPQVTCKDGAASKGGRGACSHHGGIAARAPALPAPAPTPAPMPRAPTLPPRAPTGQATQAPASPTAPGQPTARCKDGTTSYSLHHSGTCSHHGGVAQWLQ